MGNIDTFTTELDRQLERMPLVSLEAVGREAECQAPLTQSNAACPSQTGSPGKLTREQAECLTTPVEQTLQEGCKNSRPHRLREDFSDETRRATSGGNSPGRSVHLAQLDPGRHRTYHLSYWFGIANFIRPRPPLLLLCKKNGWQPQPLRSDEPPSLQLLLLPVPEVHTGQGKGIDMVALNY